MDRYHVMKVFARVAEAGSFTRASEALGISRASVSVAIQQLETHLGVRLLHRTTRRVTLTPEGGVYLERCLRMLADVDEADQLFQRRSKRLKGTLSIDAPTRIARRVIIPSLPDFLAQHKGLEVRLGASDRTVDLLELGADAVVRVGPMKDSSLVSKALGAFAMVNCASPTYVASRGTPTSVDDLRDHQVINYSPTFTGAEWDYNDGEEAKSIRVPSTVTVDSAETYIAACLAGLGLIQVPAYDVRHHIESGALVTVLPDAVAPPIPVSIVYPTRKHVPARVRAFTEWAAALFRSHGMLEGEGRSAMRRRRR